MTMNPRERDLGWKKEKEGDDISSNKFPSLIASSSSSRQWSSCFKNPRIVRVSRTFGGKDRHSKVCTIRGLRDRRIRLSVPTAIQLYDLQERLGLSQPSKVIDWLLDATKQEIDKLPPLPIIPTNFLQFHHQLPAPPSLAAASANPNPNPNPQPSSSPYHVSHQLLSPNLFKERENGDEGGFGGFVAQNFFPTNSHHQFSVENLPYNNNPNYFQLEQQPPNLSLSQFGGGFSFSNRADDDHDQEQHPNCRLSSSSHASTSQIYSCPSAASLLHFPPPYNNNFIAPSSLENDHFRQINHLQNPTVHFINSPMKSFSFNEEKQDKDSRSS